MPKKNLCLRSQSDFPHVKAESYQPGRVLWQSSQRQRSNCFCYPSLSLLIPTLLFSKQLVQVNFHHSMMNTNMEFIHILQETRKKEKQVKNTHQKIIHKSVWDYDQTSSWKLKKANVIWLQREKKTERKKIRAHKRKT